MARSFNLLTGVIQWNKFWIFLALNYFLTPIASSYHKKCQIFEEKCENNFSISKIYVLTINLQR